MWVVVTYDVCTQDREGRRRLSRVARACEGYGQRVQDSVFECQIDETSWAKLRARLLALIRPEVDSLRFYHLGEVPSGRNEHHGVRPTRDLEGPLIF